MHPDINACLREVTAVAGDAPVHAISTLTGVGLQTLSPYLQPGVTIALLGSSGVSKSTLINQLLGNEVMRTQTVRTDDSRGRHTTSPRQLFLLHRCRAHRHPWYARTAVPRLQYRPPGGASRQ